MNTPLRIILGLTILATAAAVITWQATGGDYYTKFEVVEQVEMPIPPDDPLAGTGFYDSNTRIETITRPAFKFGLLPTPARIFDKHGASVVSILAPLWVLTLIMAWRSRRRRRALHQARVT